ncbi:3'-5' exonuclease [Saprospira sp. CCB-QB6]|uniref:3'-5' exonuclease n=1 Tax=Saprospira sp. CCB-QB6 TaxID=3023936 RepID=UPI002349BF22|nr:3'-5' exonuclease [Saprospira sp. CCB-QB6]WCL82132.1 3'-5' exonuclease [Saprospira sp. CCB-QB6]
MLPKSILEHTLVLDIETVSGAASYADLNPSMQKLWDLKAEALQRRLAEEEKMSPADYYPEKAGIYAEFGKIVCITVGVYIKNETGQYKLRLKSFYGDDEKALLQDFSAMLSKYFQRKGQQYICGHNIKEFDMPYICRRLIVQGLPLPAPLQIYGKKPWELHHFLDTMTLWKFGDYKAYTSLKLLCGIFGIPTPKDGIDGSQVGRSYWEDGDLDRIEVYCKKDVFATAQVLLRFMLEDPLALIFESADS